MVKSSYMRAITLLLLLCAPALADTPIKIVATTGMIGDLVRNIGGEKVSLQTLIGSGVDPHLYKATRSDIVKIASADVVFFNGLYLEGKLIDAINKASQRSYAVTELIKPNLILDDDPHLWMDPSAWSAVATLIKNKLVQLRPADKEHFEKNYTELSKKLSDLSRKSKEALTAIEKEKRILVTAHDAFRYFGERYNFKVVGIQGISTESEAGVKDLEEIVSLLVEKKINAVFVESTVSEKNVKALLEGAKAQGHTVKIGGELFSDAMGQAGTAEGTYIGMIEHNIKTIVEGLSTTKNSAN